MSLVHDGSEGTARECRVPISRQASGDHISDEMPPGKICPGTERNTWGSPNIENSQKFKAINNFSSLTQQASQHASIADQASRGSMSQVVRRTLQ
jgi:hypothetical protein